MKDILVILDQFVIHMKPIHDFTEKAQSIDGNIHAVLEMLLELISKLLIRLGHTAELSTKGYFTKLFEDENTS